MSDCSSEGFRKEFGSAPRIRALRVPRGWRAALIAEATPPETKAPEPLLGPTPAGTRLARVDPVAADPAEAGLAEEARMHADGSGGPDRPGAPEAARGDRRYGVPRSGPGLLRRGIEKLGIAAALVLADLLAATIAFGLAFLMAELAHDLVGRPYGSLDWFLRMREPILELMLGLMVAVFAFGGLYGRASWEVDEIKRIVYASGLLGLVHLAFQVLTGDFGLNLWFLLVWPLLAMLSILLRAAVRALPPVRRAMTQHVLLVGDGISPAEFAYQMRESQVGRIDVLKGVPMAELAGRDAADLVGFLDDAARRAGLHSDQLQIVLAPDIAERAAARDLAERLWTMGHAFTAALPVDIPARQGLRVRRITGLDMVLAEHDRPGFTGLEAALKRGLDIFAAAALLVLLAPSMLIIAALLSREGPVFFAQSRVGQGGRRFSCLKFRSMRPDAEARLAELLARDPAARAEWAAHQKLARDPRITRLGSFLRRTSLDELPQLLNVIRGEMSLVGPRPMVAPEIPGYDNDRAYYESEEFVWYAACRPGISGLWQVSGRATTDYNERVRLDRWYARNWSIWLDFAILLKTLRVVVFSRTAS